MLIGRVIAFALLLLALLPLAVSARIFPAGGAPPAAAPVVTGISLSGTMTFTGGSPSGTPIGSVGVTLSFGSFNVPPGSTGLQDGGMDSFGNSCDTNNNTNFQLVSNFNLQLNATLSAGTYNVCVIATLGSSTLVQEFTIMGISQTIASISLSGNTITPGSPSGTVVGAITVIMSPGIPGFSGSCCTITGTNAADFQVVGGNLETQGVLGAGSYNIILTASQSPLSPLSQPFTITASFSNTIAGISLQATTFTQSTPNAIVGAIMPNLTGGNPAFNSAPFTGTLSLMTTGSDSNGTPCNATNTNKFQVLSPSYQLAATISGVAPGTYSGVCVQASQSGYSSWTQAFTLTAGAPPANQIVLTNVSGSTITNYHYQFGRSFIDGAIASGNCPIININGSPAAQSQFDLKNAYPDGSWRFGVGATVIPSMVNNTPVTLTFTSGSCHNTALTKTQMLATPFNFDATETLLFPAAILTGGATRLTSIATWKTVINGGFDITINGTPLTITGLNFSAVTTQAQIANILMAALNTALGTTTAVQVQSLASVRNVNDIFVIYVSGGTGISAATSPGSGTDISAMLKWTSGTLLSNIVPSTQVVSGRTMLNNGNYTLWTSGPVAQTIILADDSSGRAYDIGDGDGFHPFRPRIYATFWSGDNSVSVRLAGEQDLSTELEDMAYGVTIATGNSGPTTQDQLDLTGTGNVFGEGQTGWTSGSNIALSGGTIPNGTMTVSGTLSGPSLSPTFNGAPNIYFFEDINTATWCSFHYVNTTTITIIDNCSSFEGSFTNGASPIAIGDTLVVGNPKQAWTRTQWIEPTASSYWINVTAPSPKVNIDQNLAYMEYTRSVENYDTSVSLLGTTVTNTYGSYAPGYNLEPYDGVWDNGPPNVTTEPGNPSASVWLGLMPQWQTYWLYTGDWRMRQMSLGSADLSAAYPSNIRESDPTKILVRGGSAGSGLGLPVSIAGRPAIWLDPQQVNQSISCQVSSVFYDYQFCEPSVSSSSLPIIPGSAAINHGEMYASMPADHEIEYPYIAYVETGDPWYLNLAEMTQSSIQAGEVPSATSPSGRGPTGAYCNMVDEFRGEAWHGLNMAQTATAAPDADPFKPWLDDCENDLLAIWEGSLGITGTAYDGTNAKNWAVPLNDAESSAGMAPSKLVLRAAPTLNQWEDAQDFNVTTLLYEQEGTFNPWVVLGIYDPWIFNYVALSIGRQTELGFAAGAIQSYMAQVFNGWITGNQNSPFILSQFTAAVEKQPAFSGGGFWPDWNTLANQAYTAPWLTGVGWTMNFTSMTWNSHDGGQAAIATALPNAIDVLAPGGSVIISGATNSGTGGNAKVNGTFAVVGATDNQHYTVAMPNAPLATTGNTAAGSIHLTGIANLGTSPNTVNVGSAVAGTGIPLRLVNASANMTSSIHLTGISAAVVAADIVVGTTVSGPGIPAGDTVATIVSTTAVDLVSPTTATANGVGCSFYNDVFVTTLVSGSAVDISVPAAANNTGSAMTFTNAETGVIGTIGGSPTGTIVNSNGPAGVGSWNNNLTMSGSDGGRTPWAQGAEAMMTDNGVAPVWGTWWGLNVNNAITNWNINTHWDIVPRTDLNVLPAISTTTPP